MKTLRELYQFARIGWANSDSKINFFLTFIPRYRIARGLIKKLGVE